MMFWLFLIVAIGALYALYYLSFTHWRVETYKRLATDFDLIYRENKLSWNTLTQADLQRYSVREASGMVNGKNVIVRDVLASSGLAAIGIVQPLFQVTIVEINGESKSMRQTTAAYFFQIFGPSITNGYKSIAEVIKK